MTRKTKAPRDQIRDYFPFYPARWLTCRQLRVCSPAARGVLIDLMAMSWADGGHVSDAPDALAYALGMTPSDMADSLEELQRRGRISIEREPDSISITIPQLVEVYEEAVAYVEARRQDGLNGAIARYSKTDSPPIGTLQGGDALTGPDHTEPDLTITDHTKPDTSETFDRFWEAWPRKEGKAAARKAWPRVAAHLPAILEALAWQKNLEGWTKEGGRYIPLPASYLNGRRWEDEKPAPFKSAMPSNLDQSRIARGRTAADYAAVIIRGDGK